MNIVLDIPVDNETKEELKQYLLEQAKKFLAKKREEVLEFVETDYDDMSENIRKSFEEFFDKNWNIKDLNRFKSVDDVF